MWQQNRSGSFRIKQRKIKKVNILLKFYTLNPFCLPCNYEPHVTIGQLKQTEFCKTIVFNYST